MAGGISTNPWIGVQSMLAPGATFEAQQVADAIRNAASAAGENFPAELLESLLGHAGLLESDLGAADPTSVTSLFVQLSTDVLRARDLAIFKPRAHGSLLRRRTVFDPTAGVSTVVTALARVGNPAAAVSEIEAALAETAAEEAAAPDVEEILAEAMEPVVYREYQIDQVNRVLASVTKGSDRALLRAPTQTGKNWILPEIIGRTKEHLGNKPTLIISPYRVITKQILGDLKKMMPRGTRISVVDGTRKNFDQTTDVVVASAFTLSNPKHADKLKVDRFGLVIVDEASFTYAGSWQTILKKLGFLNDEGNFKKVEGKYLLGLTADPFALRKVFGGGDYISSHGLKWFMDKKYLHWAHDVEIHYKKDITFETVDTGDGVLRAPTASELQSLAVADAIEKNFKDKKMLVFTTTIQHALNHEAALNAKFGPGYARAIHTKMDEDPMPIVDAYSNGTGPKVLISIGMLSHGFRAVGTEAILFDYQTSSMRKFGQEFGRALGISKGEEQRNIPIAQMISRASIGMDFARVARFIGIGERIASDLVDSPTIFPNIQMRSNRKRPIVAALNTVRGVVFNFSVKSGSYQMTEGRLQTIFRWVLRKRYRNDLLEMAGDLGLGLETVDSYVYGAVPKTIADVRAVAEAMGEDPEVFVKLWEEDALDAIDYVYPAKAGGEKLKELIRMIRLTSLHLSGLGPVKDGLRQLGFDGQQEYATWKKYFDADYVLKRTPDLEKGSTLKLVYDILLRAKVVPAPMVHFAVEVLLAEYKRDKEIGPVGSIEEIPSGLIRDIIAGKRKHGENKDGFLEVDGFGDPDTYMVRNDPHEVMFWDPFSDAVSETLENEVLTENQRKALLLYLGFDKPVGDGTYVAGHEMTAKEIGEQLNVTRSRAGQILAKAFHILSRPVYHQQLQTYSDHNPLIPTHPMEDFGAPKMGRVERK